MNPGIVLVALACLGGQPAPTGTTSPFIGQQPEVLAEGFRFTEGPVWHEGALYFSDVRANAIYRWTAAGGAKIFRHDVAGACGNAIGIDGSLITAEFSRKVERTEIKDGQAGAAMILADRLGSKLFNSPNDLTVRSDGGVYFTDPPFGISRNEEEMGFSGVFLIRSAGQVVRLSRDSTRPNGIAFAPDEKTLYVADSATGRVWAYPVKEDGTTDEGKPILEAKDASARGIVDGLKVDSDGRIYVAGPGGIWVFTAKGEQVARLSVPGASNMCFGGEDGHTMFITAGPRILKIATTTSAPKRQAPTGGAAKPDAKPGAAAPKGP